MVSFVDWFGSLTIAEFLMQTIANIKFVFTNLIWVPITKKNLKTFASPMWFCKKFVLACPCFASHYLKNKFVANFCLSP